MSKTFKQGYSPLLPYIVTLGDFLVINLYFVLFFAWHDKAHTQAIIDNYTAILVCWNTSYFLAGVQRSYYAYKRLNKPGELIRSLVTHFIVFTLLFIGLTVLLTPQSKALILPVIQLLPVVLITLIIMRVSARVIVSKFREQGRNSRNMILVGNTKCIRQLFETIHNNPYTGLHIIGYFAETPMEYEPEGLTYLGQSEDAISWLKTTEKHIHRVYCQVGEKFQPIEEALLNFCESHVIKFYIIPQVSEFVHHSLSFETFNEVPMLSIRQEPLTDDVNRFIKRTFDIVFSIISLCLLFPISFIIVAIGALINKSPLFCKQQRTGMNNKPFTCYTFTSCHCCETGNDVQGNIPYEKRRRNKWECFLHRTHIDIIPQFWNVLKGDMSIVGPRPHLVDNSETYSNIVDRYLIRHYVKPGITGWSQVHGFYGEVKSLSHIRRRVKQDVWYIEHWGMYLDLHIIGMTFSFLFRK